MATKAKRPTKAQLDVLRKMAAGWKLSRNEMFGCRSWMNGPDGEVPTVSATTLNCLVKAGLVEVAARRFPRVEYRLTEAGRSALAAADPPR